MTKADLDAVLAVADVVHPDYPEDRAVFAERLALFPEGCRLAERDGRVLGYGVMHPGLLGVPPPLDAPLGALPAVADCLYLHDIALLPDTRGLGLGAKALGYAHGLAAEKGVWSAGADLDAGRARLLDAVGIRALCGDRPGPGGEAGELRRRHELHDGGGRAGVGRRRPPRLPPP
ncbi:GNAT family N-acetyltransferase [Azospirillum doebereinerae]|uniref:GNAT family N-acetyltransferase n=1 Tax=Azospirillum doebereinerae TaxID=92933 RepID=UPI00384D573F